MFHTGISRVFTARHFLAGDFGAESEPHSHPYRVEWSVDTENVDGNGFAVDISLMEESLSEFLVRIEDKLLNDFAFFSGRMCSLENVCVFFADSLTEILRRKDFSLTKISRMTIKMWESESAWASYDFIP
jgi:6-pyruvoyl-tetrahydropterin synthase